MDFVTAIVLILAIAGSLAYTNYKFDAALKEFNSGVKAAVVPDSEPGEKASVPTSRLTLSQKRALLEAKSAALAEERRAR